MLNKKEIIAGIIIIGNEVLSGRTKDINTSTISTWLNSLGIVVKEVRIIPDNQKTIIVFGDLNTTNNKLNIRNTKPLCILIGPEGDFTIKERDKILNLENIIPVKINNNILRSETAAISLISIISFKILL